MTEYISKKLTIFLCRKLKIDNDEIDLYELGIEVIVSTLITSSVILLMSLILDNFVGAVIFLSCFITVRNYSGGYHAGTRLGCFATSIVCYLISYGIVYVVAKIPHYIGEIILAAGLAAALFLFWRAAPVENPNKRLKPEWKKHNRIMTFIMLFVWMLLSGLGVWFNTGGLVRQIWATLIVIAGLLWMARR